MTANDYITMGLSIVALLVSGITYYDTNYTFKLQTSVGKQCKLYLMSMDGNDKQPCIFLNVSFVNNGGKSDSVEDIKLNVSVSNNEKVSFEQDFITVREFTNIFDDNAKTNEILPIVVNGKSSTVKKFIFYPNAPISQDLIPSFFTLKFKIFVKQNGNWKEHKNYECHNISNVWQDFSLDTINSKIVILNEKIIK